MFKQAYPLKKPSYKQVKGSHNMKYKVLSLLVAVIFLLASCTTPSSKDKLDTQAPEAPVVLLALPADAAVNVSWEANSEEDIQHYQIHVGEDQNAMAEGPIVTADKTSAKVSGLINGKKYYFVVTATDLSGNDSEPSVLLEATPTAPDSTPPSLLSSTPANGATNIATTNLSLRFSETMDVGSLSISISPEHVLGEAVWNEEATELSFTPASEFAFDTVYTLTLAAADPAGNTLPETLISFQTQAVPDTTAPEVLSNSPASSASNVDTAANLSLSFSEAMDRSSVEAAFSVNPAIDCLFLWSSNDKLVTCDPLTELASSTSYNVSLSTSATDKAANPLAVPLDFGFSTAAAPDTTAPNLIAVTPAPAANGVSRTANIVLSFSEPMDKASAQTAFSITSPAGFNAGSFSWNTEGTVMTYNPDASFDYGQTLIWKVSNAAKDLAGNALVSDSSESFKVVRQKTVKVFSTAELDGSVSNIGEVLTAPAWIVPDGIVGDLDNNTYRRTFLSFDLSSLPTDLTAINSATLYVRQFAANGSVYSDLGKVTAQHVNYGSSLTAGDFETPVLSLICKGFGLGLTTCPSVLSSDADLEFKTLNATSKLRDDWQNRNSRGFRAQYRLQFTKNASVDNDADLIAFGTGDLAEDYQPYIQISFEYP